MSGGEDGVRKARSDTLSRRDCLRAAGAGAVLAAQPVAAAVSASGPGRSPPGHSAMTPGFARIDLQK